MWVIQTTLKECFMMTSPVLHGSRFVVVQGQHTKKVVGALSLSPHPSYSHALAHVHYVVAVNTLNHKNVGLLKDHKNCMQHWA
jgi:hypothetical protein